MPTTDVKQTTGLHILQARSMEHAVCKLPVLHRLSLNRFKRNWRSYLFRLCQHNRLSLWRFCSQFQ